MCRKNLDSFTNLKIGPKVWFKNFHSIPNHFVWRGCLFTGFHHTKHTIVRNSPISHQPDKICGSRRWIYFKYWERFLSEQHMKAKRILLLLTDSYQDDLIQWYIHCNNNLRYQHKSTDHLSKYAFKKFKS